MYVSQNKTKKKKGLVHTSVNVRSDDFNEKLCYTRQCHFLPIDEQDNEDEKGL